VLVAEFIPACDLADVPPGRAHVCSVGTFEVAIFNVDGRLYAINNTCPHSGGPLGEGWIRGRVVTCPWHAWSFDVTTGKMTLGDYSSVECFDVKVEGTQVSVASEPRT
jgi:nitrite reductase (NADH) small subunit